MHQELRQIRGGLPLTRAIASMAVSAGSLALRCGHEGVMPLLIEDNDHLDRWFVIQAVARSSFRESRRSATCGKGSKAERGPPVKTTLRRRSAGPTTPSTYPVTRGPRRRRFAMHRWWSGRGREQFRHRGRACAWGTRHDKGCRCRHLRIMHRRAATPETGRGEPVKRAGRLCRCKPRWGRTSSMPAT
jgi:hypothetical protein